MSWLGKIDTAGLRVNMDAKKYLKGVRFRDDVPLVLEIQCQLTNEMVMTRGNREVIHVNAEDDDLSGRRALEE